MDKMKTYIKYVILIILFALFSNWLITAGLNSSYKKLTRKDSTSQVEITTAEATLVNGRIKGVIKDDRTDSLTGKYVQIRLFSSRDNELGRIYVPIQTTDVNREQEFKLYFEQYDVKSYDVSIVNEKNGGTEIEVFPKEMTKAQIFVITLFTVMFAL